MLVELKLGTTVVETTVMGGVPVITVDAKPGAVKIPVEGTKVSLVPAVRCPKLPEVLVTNVG